MTRSREQAIGQISVRQRIGWLLRSHRLLTDDGRVRPVAAVARELRAGTSSVSRWETGRLAVPHRVVRGYERIHQLPPHSLVAVLDTMLRYRSGRVTGAPVMARSVPAGIAIPRLEGLLDRACDGSALSGADWDELTAILASMPAIYLRATVWSRLTGRLVAELMIADGVRWHQRYEALGRLMAHPAGQRAAVDACVTASRDRSGQMFIELVCALECSPLPDASRAVVAQLEHPTNDPALCGALMACVRKIRLGHFSPDQRRRVDAVLRDMSGSAGAAAALAAEVTRSAGHRAGPPAGGDVPAAVVVRRVVDRVRRELPQVPESYDDHVLPLLVSEMLYAGSAGERLCAGNLLAASPYRTGLAAAVSAELRMHRVPADRPDWADRLLVALRAVGGSAERRLLERLALDPAVPLQVARTAAYSIGHLDGQPGQGFWHRLLAARAVRPGVLDGLVYSAGTDRAWTALATVRERRELPVPLRTAAGWWLGLPRTVVDSAAL